MTEKNFVTKIHIYSYNELSDEDKNLVDMAKEATKASYAANYPGVPIKKIAIASFTRGDFVEMPTAPCGVCRQALLEFETQASQPIEVILVGKNIIYKLDSIKSLLPLAFSEF